MAKGKKKKPNFPMPDPQTLANLPPVDMSPSAQPQSFEDLLARLKPETVEVPIDPCGKDDPAAFSAAVGELFDEDSFVSALAVERLRQAVAEKAKRRIEALKLYQPLPPQAQFHQSKARIRLLRGSNRGGKTLAAAVECARAVTGLDPHKKYPLEDGRAFLVGKDQKHLAQVMYRKLFRNGAFRIIRDRVTGRWRSWRPWEPDDRQRESETRPAPPLIPPRFIASMAWENKKEEIPSTIRLRNGWELCFFSSLGKPPQGVDVDFWWFDEEIVDPAWYPEMFARILDRKGRGMWSATPQAGTDQLYELHERAAAERGMVDPEVEEFVVLLENNPFISEREKRAFAANLSDEERRVRVGGEFAIMSYKIYPEYSQLVHGIEKTVIPDTWTRYVYVDPGHQICAALFVAVPPPDEEKMVLLYDELYIRECTANEFGLRMRQKTEGQRFQAFLMDYHMGIHTELGIGRTVMQQYSEALARHGVASVATGSSFTFASDDIQAGIMAVKDLLRVRENGKPILRVLVGRLPNFDYEIKRYHRKRSGGVVTDVPDNRRQNHLMDCLRYMALHGAPYVRPPLRRPTPAPAYRAFKEKLRRRQRDDTGVVRLGPPERGEA